MNINYKYTTILFATLFIITAFIALNNRPHMDSNMHMMPDGTMMHHGDMQMSHSNTTDMSGMMMDMVANMRGKSGTELEKVFITDMIPHHQGAVDMARLLLQDQSIKPELRTFAENIISAQESEITQMNEWLKNYK